MSAIIRGPAHFPQLEYLDGLSRLTGNKFYALRGGAFPSGSVKYVSVVGMLQHMMNLGNLRGVKDVYASTSGNTGMAAAMICREMGLRFHAVIDPRTTSEQRMELVELGADLIEVNEQDPEVGFVGARIRKVQELVRGKPEAIDLDQYGNPGALLGHYELTGPWLFEQMDGRIDVLICAIGTGGTFGGIAHYLIRRIPHIITVPVDCLGSRVIYGKPEPHLLTGIGAAFIPLNALRAYGAVRGTRPCVVTDRDAFLAARWLRETEGIGVGGSGGAVLVAAMALSSQIAKRRFAIIFHDDDRRYASTIFNDDWMKSKGFLS
jgi:cysteine synthase